jgi:hypothetical protein
MGINLLALLLLMGYDCLQKAIEMLIGRVIVLVELVEAFG